MKVTTLPRLKRHILHQCQYNSGKWRNFAKKSSSLIKQLLSYGSMMRHFDEVEVFHVHGTSTLLVPHDVACNIVEKINAELNHNVIKLSADIFQKIPNDVSHCTITSTNVSNLMRFVFSFQKKHQLKKLKKDPAKKEQDRAKQEKRAINRYREAKSLFDEGMSFLCFDVEAFEFRQSIILEIGVSTYQDGRFDSEHFIISEHTKYKNKKFVPNNRDNFLFGESEPAPLNVAVKRLNALISRHDCIVGHSIGGDVNQLLPHGLNFSHSKKIIDTAVIGKVVLKQDKSRPSLKDLAEQYGIDMKFHHNGGNDSRYNLETFVKMVDSVTEQVDCA